jgi:hypothetical protein
MRSIEGVSQTTQTLNKPTKQTMAMISMIATGMSAKRMISLPLIIIFGVWNIIYSVNQHSSPIGLSTTITVGPDEIHHHAKHEGEAFQQYIQEQQLQPENLQGSTREIHRLHKEGNPSLIFHVGPAHTFASELQAELTRLSSDLAADNYTLAFNSSFLTDFECHKQLNIARKNYDVMKKKKGKAGGRTLKQYISKEVQCWSEALKVLESHRAKGESIIVSDESLSNRWYRFEGISLAPVDWIALQETVGALWNIEIVVGYRRYDEWLPEAVRAASQARYQELLHEAKPPKPQKEDRVIKPLFPDLVQSAAADGGVMVGSSVNATYTNTMLERYLYRSSGKSKIPVTLLNVHTHKSVGSTFVCNVLYAASTACQASQVRSVAAKDATKAAALALKKARATPVQDQDFYEFLVAYATDHSMYRTKHISKQGAIIAARYHQEVVLNKTAADFPLKCPSKDGLQQLLDVSLKHERNLQPVFARSHDGEDEHRRHFADSAKGDKMLCSIDIKKVLRIREWRNFFHDLPKGVPGELLQPFIIEGPKKSPLAVTREFISSNNKVIGRVTTLRRRKAVY